MNNPQRVVNFVFSALCILFRAGYLLSGAVLLDSFMVGECALKIFPVELEHKNLAY